MQWLLYAFMSAGASAVTAILAKLGVEGVPSTLATAIRTVVVLVVAWTMVFALNEQRAIPALSKRSVVFLVLSGIATGAAWLAYFRALQLGPASRVAPIDKLSLPLTIALASLWLGEPLSWRLVAGVMLMTTGALLTILWDVAVIDLSFGDRGGIELLKALKAIRPNVSVLVFSSHSEDVYARRSFTAG